MKITKQKSASCIATSLFITAPFVAGAYGVGIDGTTKTGIRPDGTKVEGKLESAEDYEKSIQTPPVLSSPTKDDKNNQKVSENTATSSSIEEKGKQNKIYTWGILKKLFATLFEIIGF